MLKFRNKLLTFDLDLVDITCWLFLQFFLSTPWVLSSVVDPIFGQNSDPGPCTSNERWYLKYYGINIWDNVESLLICSHIFSESHIALDCDPDFDFEKSHTPGPYGLQRRSDTKNMGTEKKAFNALDLNLSKIRIHNPESQPVCCHLLGVPYITANIYSKARNLPNSDIRNYSIDLR